MKYKFVSENTLEFLPLHDCLIEEAYNVNGKLVFEFGHVDILPDHPLNPFEVAKCSGKASIMFEDFEVIESNLYDTSDVYKKEIIVEKDARRVDLDVLELAKEFEVLKVDKIAAEEEYYIYEFHGIASLKYPAEFGFFRLKFKTVKICWNDLQSDAWFVR